MNATCPAPQQQQHGGGGSRPVVSSRKPSRSAFAAAALAATSTGMVYGVGSGGGCRTMARRPFLISFSSRLLISSALLFCQPAKPQTRQAGRQVFCEPGGWL